MSEDKVSHFDKSISEITMEEVDRMSREDLAEYIIEHPWSYKVMGQEDRDSFRACWSYSSLMQWALRWCEELSKRGDEQDLKVSE